MLSTEGLRRDSPCRELSPQPANPLCAMCATAIPTTGLRTTRQAPEPPTLAGFFTLPIRRGLLGWPRAVGGPRSQCRHCCSPTPTPSLQGSNLFSTGYGRGVAVKNRFCWSSLQRLDSKGVTALLGASSFQPPAPAPAISLRPAQVVNETMN